MESKVIFIVNTETSIIENALMFDTLADAEVMFPSKLCVERVFDNQHLEVGDVLV